jgi:phage shock protein A
MISEIEKRREEILRQLNNQGRRLERLSPDAASALNAGLSKLVEKLAEQLAQTQTGRGPKVR